MIGRILPAIAMLYLWSLFAPVAWRYVEASTSPTLQAPPLCPGFEPNDYYDTPIILSAPASWLDSVRFKAPEADYIDIFKVPVSAVVTQTIKLHSQGPGSDPLLVLAYFDNDDPNTGIKRNWRIIDDLDKARCLAGEFWMCSAFADFVWTGPQRLFLEVYMVGSLTPEPTCRYYRLEYSDVPRPVTPTPTATPSRVYLPAVFR